MEGTLYDSFEMRDELGNRATSVALFFVCSKNGYVL